MREDLVNNDVLRLGLQVTERQRSSIKKSTGKRPDLSKKSLGFRLIKRGVYGTGAAAESYDSTRALDREERSPSMTAGKARWHSPDL
jgi:hypothetical protein